LTINDAIVSVHGSVGVPDALLLVLAPGARLPTNRWEIDPSGFVRVNGVPQVEAAAVCAALFTARAARVRCEYDGVFDLGGEQLHPVTQVDLDVDGQEPFALGKIPPPVSDHVAFALESFRWVVGGSGHLDLVPRSGAPMTVRLGWAPVTTDGTPVGSAEAMFRFLLSRLKIDVTVRHVNGAVVSVDLATNPEL